MVWYGYGCASPQTFSSNLDDVIVLIIFYSKLTVLHYIKDIFYAHFLQEFLAATCF